MSFASGLAIYFLIWWVTLFAVLPFRVRSQYEAGEVIKGSEGAAPVKPYIGMKLLITSLIALVVFGGVYLVVLFKPIPLSAIPIVGSV